MEWVDDDGVGAKVDSMGKVFFESRSGWHVTSEQLKGWIDDWLAWHVKQVAARRRRRKRRRRRQRKRRR